MTNKKQSWFVYIIQCSDNSYYTGITTDIDRRLNEHNTGKGAKYTKGRLPVVLEESLEFPDMTSASKEEYRIKQLSRNNKELLIGKWRIDRLRKEFVI
jgi:putative endonuclease